MPIDPKGTTPGLATPETTPATPTVNMTCKNPRCTSIQATELDVAAVLGRKLYRCVACGTTWGVAVGGEFPF